MQLILYFEHCTTLLHISLAPAAGSSAVTWRRGAAQPPSLSVALVMKFCSGLSVAVYWVTSCAPAVKPCNVLIVKNGLVNNCSVSRGALYCVLVRWVCVCRWYCVCNTAVSVCRWHCVCNTAVSVCRWHCGCKATFQFFIFFTGILRCLSSTLNSVTFSSAKVMGILVSRHV